MKQAEKPKKEEPKVDRLASILKNVEKLQEDATSQQQPKPKPQPQPQQSALSSQPMSSSEIDRIRQHVQKYWNFPVGAPDPESLIVDLRVYLNPDGSVLNVEIMDRTRFSRDQYFRAAAESAVRAVKQASPLPIPQKKYNELRQIVLGFDPREILRQ